MARSVTHFKADLNDRLVGVLRLEAGTEEDWKDGEADALRLDLTVRFV
jgi:hypothetical protein